MSAAARDERLYPVRLLTKDLGVALVVVVALAVGWLLHRQADGRVTVYDEPDTAFSVAYPAAWAVVESLQEALLKVEDSQTESTFKTAVTVERRDLDPASPPTLQALVDRRIAQRGALTAYRFLDSALVTVGGASSARIEYAYVVQPIDQPRRAALPVVVRAREYLIVARDRSYLITLAAPETAFPAASARFEEMIRTVTL